MMRNGGGEQDDTKVNDLDAFEEWEHEAGVAPEATPAEEEGDVLPAFAAEPEDAAPEEMPSEPAPSHPAGEPEPTAAETFAESLLSLAPDVPVSLVAVIGKTTWSVGELLKLKLGQVVELGRPPSETVDVVANGRLIARGELVDIDGQLGIRILKMVR